MGWAKYAEDNFEAFYERQALKGGLEPEQRYSFQTTKKLWHKLHARPLK